MKAWRPRTGAQLEGLVEASCEVYRSRGEAFLVKIPTPITAIDGQAVYRRGRKAPVDFVGTACGRPLAVECKTSRQSYWHLGYMRDEQWAWMEDWQRAGGIAYLLLELLGQACMIPWPTLVGWKAAGHRHLSLAEAMSIGHVVRSQNGVPLDFLAPIRALLSQHPCSSARPLVS